MLQALIAYIQAQAPGHASLIEGGTWKAIILGLVEGITEFIPISSTGHLVLAESMLGLDTPPDLKHATDTFIITNREVRFSPSSDCTGLRWCA